jgi:hypothetical protein
MRRHPLRGSQRSSRWPEALPPTAAGPLLQRISGRPASGVSLDPGLKLGGGTGGFPTPQLPESLSLSGVWFAQPLRNGTGGFHWG